MSAFGAGPSYRALLRLPHARRLFGAAAVGRLGYAVAPLALFFTIRNATGSFGAAGLVVAAVNLAVVVLGPVRARLVDRYGRRRALPGLALAYLTGNVTLVLSALAHVPLAGLIAVGLLAGSLPPPIGPSMRAIWADLAPDLSVRQRAYSLDAVSEEVLFTVGPLFTGLALAFAQPWSAVTLGLALVVGGTLALALGPTPARGPSPPDQIGPDPVDHVPASGSARGSLLRRPGFAALVLTVAGLSSGLGLLGVLVPVSAVQAGHPAVAGPLEALVAAGSAIGGLVYGRGIWRASAPVLLWRLGVGLAVIGAGLAVSQGLTVLAVGLFLAGLTFSPTLIIAYTLGDRLAPASARTEASGWINTASNAGMTVGTALAGVAADRVPLWAIYLAVGAIPVVAASAATPAIGRALTGED